jgi:hypothetical protein
MTPPMSPSRQVVSVALTRDGRVRDEGALDRLVGRARDASDCFVFCAGWQDDEAQARHAAARFFALLDGALLALGDRVTPMRVALHWPSLPFGDTRDLPSGGLWPELERQVAGGALGLSFDVGRLLHDLCAAEVPRSPEEEVELAALLHRMADDLRRGAVPLSAFQALSCWTMKRRAGDVGEQFGRAVLGPLWNSLPKAPRLHLIGHSFGARLVTSAVAGGVTPDSLTLLLGAFSAFAFAPEVPGFHRPGLYHALLDGGRLWGPIVVLRSAYDRALDVLYPRLGSSATPVTTRGDHHSARAVAASALGVDGARGVGAPEIDLVDAPIIGLPRRRVVNVDGSRVVRAQAPVIGAHRDIHHAEIATLALLAADLLRGGPDGVRPPRAEAVVPA